MGGQKNALQAYLEKFPDTKASYQGFKQKQRRPQENPNPESWSTSFPNSQMECVQQLRLLRQKLKGEQASIQLYINEHHQRLIRQLEDEYRILKTQFCKELDKAFEESKLKVNQGFGSVGMDDLDRITSDIRNVSLRIQQLLLELETSSGYKRGIAQTVTQDFQNRRRVIVSQVRDALNHYQGNAVLKVDEEVFEKIKADIRVLFIYHGANRGNYSHKPRNYSSQMYRPNTASERHLHRLHSDPVEKMEQPENFLEPPHLQKQPFSFQPSKASENHNQQQNKHVSPSQSYKLRQSQSREFKNDFARNFQSEYPNNIVNSQIQLIQRQSPSRSQLNSHRNRDQLRFPS